MFARFGRGFPGAPGGYPGDGFGMRPRVLGPHLFPFGGLLFAIFVIAVLAVVVFLYWRILQKAGFEGALALLMFVPLVNLGLVAYLALADWPVLKELRERRVAYATTAVPEVTPAAAPQAVADDETVGTPTAPLDDVTPPADAPTEPLERTRKHPSAEE